MLTYLFTGFMRINTTRKETNLQYIVDTRQELKPRYVDSSLFELIGKFVDWKALLKEHNEALQVALD